MAKIPSPVITTLSERLGDKKKDCSCEDSKTDRALRSLQSNPACPQPYLVSAYSCTRNMLGLYPSWSVLKDVDSKNVRMNIAVILFLVLSRD